MTQRNGRIIRQGNMNKEVKVFNYVTEGTFDSYLFQTLENAQNKNTERTIYYGFYYDCKAAYVCTQL